MQLTKLAQTMSHIQLSELTGIRRDSVIRSIKKSNYPYRVTNAINHKGQRFKLYEMDYMSAIDFMKSLTYRNLSQNEHGALCAIEQLLNIKLIRQYPIGKYRIDGYHEESNTAYEIDESQHFVNGELKQECKDRQAYIESKLGCKFVRIKV